jgi:hypothetical protein
LLARAARRLAFAGSGRGRIVSRGETEQAKSSTQGESEYATPGANGEQGTSEGIEAIGVHSSSPLRWSSVTWCAV